MGWRIAWRAFVLLMMAVVIFACSLFVVWFFRWRPLGASQPTPTFTEAEFITIVLAALTAVLAALAIVLAVAGAVGYVTIKDAAKSAAEREAAKVAVEVATKTVKDVTPRFAEEAVLVASERDKAAGDRMAQASGEEDAGGS